MKPQIIICDQGSPEWYAARLGLPTASEFATIMAQGRDGGASKTRRTYMLKLAGEIITEQPMENYTNAHMERGKAMEDEARADYAFMENVDCVRVGFIRNGNTGCSPDSLIGSNRMLEIKTALPHILAALILKDEFPPEHKAQCQGGLWVAQRDEIDLTVYWPNMPRFVKRAGRDEPYIKEIAAAVDQFNTELHETVEKIKRYGGPLEQAA